MNTLLSWKMVRRKISWPLLWLGLAPGLVSSLAASTGVEFADLTPDSDVTYALVGKDTSTVMSVQLVNHSDTIYLVHVDVGTKLTPSNGDVQAMVVTKEIHVTVHPHETQRVDLEVACLDISKDPPGSDDYGWTVTHSSRLKKFIACVNDYVDEQKKNADDGEQLEQNRQSVIQLALWKARGASRDDLIEFWVKYMELAKDAAEKQVDELNPELQKILDRCPAL